MHRWCCRDHANYYVSKLQFDNYALLSRKGFCWEYTLLSQNRFHCKYTPFWVCLVQTFTQTFRIWLRFCADIWTKNQRLAALEGASKMEAILNVTISWSPSLTLDTHFIHMFSIFLQWTHHCASSKLFGSKRTVRERGTSSFQTLLLEGSISHKWILGEK